MSRRRDQDAKPPEPIDVPKGVELRLRRAPDRTWAWSYRVRWAEPGTSRRPVFESFDLGEVLDFQAQVRLARRRGGLEDLTRGEVLLRVFVETEWWPNDACRNLEAGTLPTYAPVWNRHLNPRLGHLKLRQITPPVVQQLREDMEHDGIGAPTIKRAMAILQAICRYAVSKGQLTSNPCKEIKKPSARPTKPVIAISPEQVEQLRDILLAGFTYVDKRGTHVVPPDPMSAALVSVLAYEGFRPEEALALDDDHVRRSTILIEQRLRLGQIHVGQKGMGRRGFRSPELFVPVRADLAQYRLAVKWRPPGCSLLFPRPDGLPWKDHDYRNWRRRVFKPAVKKAGLPITRPYALRHACASLLLAAGRPIPEVADHMGHSLAVLSETYAHVIADLRGQPVVDVNEAIMLARGKRARPAADGTADA